MLAKQTPKGVNMPRSILPPLPIAHIKDGAQVIFTFGYPPDMRVKGSRVLGSTRQQDPNC